MADHNNPIFFRVGGVLNESVPKETSLNMGKLKKKKALSTLARRALGHDVMARTFI